MPIRTSLLDRQGRELPLQLEGENEPGGTERVLELTEARQSFTFIGLDTPPVPSVLRGFSAPVLLEVEEDDATLAFRFAHDTDAFNRWDAGQTLALRLILRAVEQRAQGHDVPLDPGLARAFRAIAKDSAADPAFAARALSLPGFAYVGEKLPVIDVDGIHGALDGLRRQLAAELREVWAELYDANRDQGAFSLDSRAMGRRALKNLALLYRARNRDRDAVTIAERQFDRADNMTDSIAALRALLEAEASSADAALAAFYERWQHEPLVVNKWFALQASHERPDALERVERLRLHPAFTMSNPNRLRSLIAMFATANPVGFHRRDGKGYAFLADRVIELDPRNPQVAARLLTPLGRWRRFDPARQKLMRQELERVAQTPGLSRDTREIATKSLA
jgi:aminopeptidase N